MNKILMFAAGQKKVRSLSLDFTALGTGGMVGLIGSTWTRSASGAVNTPTASGELVTNGGFDANADGWTSTNANLTSAASGQAGNCLNIENTTTSNGIARQQIATVVDTWYTFSAYHKNGTSSGIIRLATTSSGSDIFNGAFADASWINKPVSFRALTTSTYIRLINNSSTGGTNTQFDTVTLMPITLPTLFAWKKFATAYGIVKAGFNGVAGTPWGVHMNMDNPSNPTNMITCIHDGTNLVFSKRLNGAVTPLINTAVTKVDGAAPEIRRALGTNTYQAFYNGSQVGTDQTISDASIINNKYHGIMSTHSQNQCLNFSFVGA